MGERMRSAAAQASVRIEAPIEVTWTRRGVRSRTSVEFPDDARSLLAFVPIRSGTSVRTLLERLAADYLARHAPKTQGVGGPRHFRVSSEELRRLLDASGLLAG